MESNFEQFNLKMPNKSLEKSTRKSLRLFARFSSTLEIQKMIFGEKQNTIVMRVLERRSNILIGLAHLQNSPLDKADRFEIIHYLEKRETPPRPDTIPSLMRSFVKSCFTYAPLRNFCIKILGEIPQPDTISECMARIFHYGDFRIEFNWIPENLYKIADKIRQKERYNLNSNQPKPRMIRVMHDGSLEMKKRLENGISDFYASIDRAIESGPESMWNFVNDFSKNIYNVGPALICDFIKEIGYAQFVKVDHHFQKQFPTLLNNEDCKKLSPKKHFILSQDLAKQIGMTPYLIDKILYNWGRYASFAYMVQ